ncbi:hypothetical protein VC83_03264 [Pseudogymnoascus destructans]|uniref:WSC domain-containing protein n=2 Tax=Pseudogymnoascus destructans TaxID=655981 RepID=L8G3X6_PSED2|nr:uncharacterized protein VC83_03264 [Pseudogymnoascus destructans]ELR06631.1 hypothetical protein GMDG_08104 [Pseudogymnoascus destructans 20631-21]OAF60381.1 hypothetical protein VC83_03264 [Pseudogymnoascus destructans]
MPRPSSSLLLALLGSVTSTIACTIPTTPPGNTILDKFSIVVQNPNIPTVHNKVMRFRANGDDEHLVLPPVGVATNDVLYLQDGRLIYNAIHSVIDLEYNDQDDTTKMFMTAREYHPSAVFNGEYACDPDTDELQIRLKLVSRLTDPPVLGGQIGIRDAVGTLEFRYSPPGNTKINNEFMPVEMVIFRNGVSPTGTAKPPTSTAAAQSSAVIPTTTAAPPTGTGVPTTPTSPDKVGDYEFLYCWAEPAAGRAFAAKSTAADDMTLAKCAAFCAVYQYFGTEWSKECWCGNEVAAGSDAAPLGECDHPCAGDATQLCGGSRRLSVYQNSAATGPQQPDTVGNFEFHGCLSDNQGQRTLAQDMLRSDDMTLEICATFCGGYRYFGTEWSTECWCGNTVTTGATTVDAGQCSMTCGGNGDLLCGNGNRLSVYKVKA